MSFIYHINIEWVVSFPVYVDIFVLDYRYIVVVYFVR